MMFTQAASLLLDEMMAILAGLFFGARGRQDDSLVSHIKSAVRHEPCALCGKVLGGLMKRVASGARE